MSEEEKIDPRHSGTRSVLRVCGPILAGLGLLFIVIGMVSFFSAFGGFEPPRYFWCVFLGMPLLFVGLAMAQFGYAGSVYRYFSGEVSPVAKDTFNYLAGGTQQGVRDVTRAAAEGFSAGAAAGPRCPRCNQVNAAGARFCDQCGAPLAG